MMLSVDVTNDAIDQFPAARYGEQVIFTSSIEGQSVPNGMVGPKDPSTSCVFREFRTEAVFHPIQNHDWCSGSVL